MNQIKSLYDVDKIKSELLEAEEKRLRQIYPDYDSWRAPQNIADSIGCVGYAQVLLNNFKAKLNNMTDTEIIKLYGQKK
ncbi:MAG: hypothetical protein IKT46_08980 [Clostridia bacterium]|nr:hypothetical protein [Clostridia bacterium]